MGLGVELVGIAHHLFFQRLWHHVGVGGWQSLAQERLAMQARACMALSHTGMALPTLPAQHLATYLTVQQVGLRAVTVDGRGVAPAHTKVVEHGCLLQELTVERQLGVTVADEQTTVGYLTGVKKKQMAKVRRRLAICMF